MQNLEMHAIPVPGLPGFTALRAASREQRVVKGQRTPYIGCGLGRQNSYCTAHVVGIAMAEHDAVEVDLLRLQKRHQHAVPGIAVQAVARAGVVEQGVVAGSHQHRIALANVRCQQLKCPMGRCGCMPQGHGQKQGQA